MKHKPNIRPLLPQPKYAPKLQHLPAGRQVRYSIFIILLAAALTTCQKLPEPPTGGNKIELGKTVVDSVAYFEAKVSTTIQSTGGNQITQHGHCWSTKSNPTTDDAKTTLGKLDKSETFTSDLTGLQDNTTYYVRSYTTYPYGTVYGTEQNIKTLKAGKPVVKTQTITNITLYSAKYYGAVLADSGIMVVARGFCWDTTVNVTIENSIDTTVTGKGLGSFNKEITGLNEGVTYFVKAYAINEKGTSYGVDKQFTTIPITLPEVTTEEVTEITINSAKSGGNVANAGNGTVTTRGACWDTVGNPSLENSIGYTIDGSGTGSFVSNISGLNDGVKYFIRAYAANDKGTGYGETRQFTTIVITFPEVNTNDVTDITTNSATGGGNVTSDGNGTVTARGVCWNTTGNPILENSEGYTTDGSGTGSFSSNITGLNDGVEYFVRAYATNEKDTGYGDEISFETLDLTPCDGVISFVYEGQTYYTVEIGYQCWMKENLNYETGNSWCYDDNPANCDIYGRLYDWATIMNGASSSNEVPSGVQGICPDGWHIPSDVEWEILEGNADTQYGVGDSEWDNTGWRGYDAGKRLKSTSGWNSNGNGTNTFGFSALPGGYRYVNGGFDYIGYGGYWWSATESSSYLTWYRYLFSNIDKAYRNYNDKEYGFNVRCVRD